VQMSVDESHGLELLRSEYAMRSRLSLIISPTQSVFNDRWPRA
jgi:hypothetical protein